MAIPPRFRMGHYEFWILAVLGALLPIQAAWAQGPPLRAVEVTGIEPGPARHSLSDQWGTLQLRLSNGGTEDRNVRVVVFYSDRPDIQYGRDVWMPAKSAVSTWLPIGPPSRQWIISDHCELQYLLYDRTDRAGHLQLPSRDERIRSATAAHRRHEVFTDVFLGEGQSDPGEDRDSQDAIEAARVFRQSAGLSEMVGTMEGGTLPPVPEALSGVDHVILAGRCLGNDPIGRQTLRRWLQHGGTVWVMLDRADPDVVADLLADAPAPTIVGRTTLTSVVLRRVSGGEADRQELEKPVAFLHVLTDRSDTVLHTVDGWPASFTRPVGRGKVLFTALGARGWYRPRGAQEQPSPFPEFPDTPVSLPALDDLAVDLVPVGKAREFSVTEFGPLLSDQIGYSIVGPGPVAALLGAFLLAVLLAGVWLRRSRRAELVGWLGPAAAVVVGAVFALWGEQTRRVIPPSVAAVNLIDATAGSQEQPVTGLVAVYRPTAGRATVAADHGGALQLDMAGLQGETLRWIATDAGAWHWEDFDLPAGLRLGSFAYTTHLDHPPAAGARFEANGSLNGKLLTGSLTGLEDVVLSTPSGRPRAVILQPDGSFVADDRDLLPGQYLSGTVLSDKQQRRQAIYRSLLGEALPLHLQNRTALFAWEDKGDVPFTFDSDAHRGGGTLLVVPIRFTRPTAGSHVTVPGAFLQCKRVLEGRAASRPPLRGNTPIDMRLRFQVPPKLLPLKIERARFSMRVRAVARQVTVSGIAGNKVVALKTSDEPDGTLEVEIQQPEFLHLDAEGGLQVEVAIGLPLRQLPAAADGTPNKDETWTLASVPQLSLVAGP